MIDKRNSLYVLALTTINFILQCDFVVLMPLGPTLMKSFGLSPAEFSTLISVYTISSGIIGIIFSLVVNLFNKKHFLLIGLLGLGIASYMTGVSKSYEQLALARLLAGLFSGIVNPLIFAIVADIIHLEVRGKAMGWIMSGFSLASVLGVPFGLYLSDTFGHYITFSVIALIFGLIFVLVIFTIPSIPRTETSLNFRTLFHELRRALNNPSYVLGYSLLFIVSGSIFLLVPLLSPFAVANMKIDVTNLKYMYLIGGILTIFTSRVFGVLTDKLGPHKTFTIASIGSCIPIYLFTTSGPINLIWFFVLGSVFMSLISGKMVPSMTLVSGLPSPEDRGRFMGILNSMRGFGSAIFAYFAGVFVTSATPTSPLIGFNVMGIYAIGLTIISVAISLVLSIRDN